jgi:hypothetical protein
MIGARTMSHDDDFPPTQAAPPPPPEPRRRPARVRREPSEAARTQEVYESVEQMLPPRTWKENPMIWIGLVVAMFLAVPLLASMATSGKSTAKRAPAAAAASTPADTEPAAPAVTTSVAAPAAVPVVNNTAPTPAPVVPSDAPPALRAQTNDPTRQVITKCYEKGRVVYTQTGACTGSMSAVPIDTGKNVVGTGGAAAAQGDAKR